jgi:hypothetical protein
VCAQFDLALVLTLTLTLGSDVAALVGGISGKEIGDRFTPRGQAKPP